MWNWNLLLHNITILIFISMSVSVISLTVTKTKIFLGLRKWIDVKTSTKNKKSLISELFVCPYCFSFYPSFLFTLIFFSDVQLIFNQDVQLIFSIIHLIFEFIISWFCIICITSIFTGIIYSSISKIE